MWVSRTRFERLVATEARVVLLEEELRQARHRAEAAEARAERAVDAALVSRNVLPLTPQKSVAPSEQPGMFDDDPKELARMMKSWGQNPTRVLFEVGSGDQSVYAEPADV